MGLPLAGRLVARRGLLAMGDAGAIDQDALLPMRRARTGERSVNCRLAGDIDFAEHAADVAGDRLSDGGIAVENRDAHAPRRQSMGRRFAQPRGAPGDDCRHARIDDHRLLPRQ